jgi:hypothetical protein
LKGEVIFFRLTDVGRRIDLQEVAKIIPAIPDKRIIKTKDTPSYLDFPKPLNLEITQTINSEAKFIKNLNLNVKLYEDGVISLIARISFENLSLEGLHTLRRVIFNTPDGEFNIMNYLKFQYQKIFDQVKEFIEEEIYIIGEYEHEKYSLFCLTDEIENPVEFIHENKDYIATLLMGENPNLNLNQIQVENTLGHPFSFLKNDLTIFDFDRGFIIDPNSDYEDIILVLEIANYQLLELRALDKLLDKRVTIAEDDIRKIYFKSRTVGRRLRKKIGNLFRIQYDLTFLLENIENVSKLIGDFYLAQIYSYLSKLFQLKQWSDSIHHRLETLGDIYNITQTNSTERILLLLEILLAFIFIMEFILLLLDYFL